jgi:hypothetical protein
MKKSYCISFILILLILFTIDAKAQVSPEEKNAYDLSELSYLGGTRIYSVNMTDVEGTPFLNEDFKKGRFLFTSGKQSEVVPINFDLERNLILYKKDSQTLILENVKIKGFTFEKPTNSDLPISFQEKYTFRLPDNEFNVNGLTPIQVLYDQNGAVKLFAVPKVKLVRGHKQDPFTGKVTNRYENETEYFLKTPDDEIHELRRLRAKDIINAIGDDSKKVLNRFIDENDLNEKSEEDLVRLLSYYDNEIAAGNN